MSHIIITTTGHGTEFAGLQLATGFGHVTEEIAFTPEQLVREGKRLIEWGDELAGLAEQRQRRRDRRQQHEDTLALVQRITTEGTRYVRFWNEEGDGESGPMSGHVDGYRLGQLTVELSRGDLYVQHEGTCHFPTRLDYMAPCNEFGRGGGVDFRVRRLLLDKFGRDSGQTSLLHKRRREVLRHPERFGYGHVGSWFRAFALRQTGCNGWDHDGTVEHDRLTPCPVHPHHGFKARVTRAGSPFVAVGVLMYDSADDSLTPVERQPFGVSTTPNRKGA